MSALTGVKQVFGSAMEAVFGIPKQSQQPQPMQQGPAGITNNLQAAPNMNTSTTQLTAPNGVVPEGGNKAPEPEPSPLASHAKLWETEPVDPNNKEPTSLTTEQMLAAASKVDFTQVLDQASLAKITAGGEEAVQALAVLLNKTAQSVYGQSTVVANKLIEKAVNDAKVEFASQIPTMVKKQSLRELSLKENPAYTNPAVAPVIQAVQAQLAEKYPNATTEELSTMAKEYFNGAAEIFRPTPKKQLSKEAQGEDWEEYLS